jgi:hypothetical protein
MFSASFITFTRDQNKDCFKIALIIASQAALGITGSNCQKSPPIITKFPPNGKSFPIIS